MEEDGGIGDEVAEGGVVCAVEDEVVVGDYREGVGGGEGVGVGDVGGVGV